MVYDQLQMIDVSIFYLDVTYLLENLFILNFFMYAVGKMISK